MAGEDPVLARERGRSGRSRPSRGRRGATSRACGPGGRRACRRRRRPGRPRRFRGRRSRSSDRRPGSAWSASIVLGTRPPCVSTIVRQAPRIDLALALKKPVDRISSSSSAPGPGHRGGVREAAEERRRDAVHPRVRALRGEDRRDEELKRVGMVERAVGPGVGLVQASEDVGGGRGTRLRGGRAWRAEDTAARTSRAP